MSDKPILLGLYGVEKRYGRRQALAIDRLEVAAGDRILLSGTNGSGKSTLLRILAGVSVISRGRIERAAEFRNMVIGYVPQLGGLYADMTLRQNLHIYARMYDTQPIRQPEELWLIRDTSLRSFVDVPVGAMSGGIHQLAAFACVLSAGPHALLLDEPASELDAANATLIYDCLASVRQSLAFLIVSSHENRSYDFVTRQIVMKDGCILP
jgi:ABC-type multidrug transport system ATPase subunit